MEKGPKGSQSDCDSARYIDMPTNSEVVAGEGGGRGWRRGVSEQFGEDEGGWCVCPLVDGTCRGIIGLDEGWVSEDWA